MGEACECCAWWGLVQSDVSAGQVDHSTGQQDSPAEGGSLGELVGKLCVSMAT